MRDVTPENKKTMAVVFSAIFVGSITSILVYDLSGGPFVVLFLLAIVSSIGFILTGNFGDDSW